MKRYLSEQIGEKYRQWKTKDMVIISTPTGSGKTTFISQVLLPYATERNEKIIYICNRRALKEQDLENFRKDLEMKYPHDPNFVDRCLDHIFVQTYQYCEAAKAYPAFRKLLSVREQENKKEEQRTVNVTEAAYYIFDEAHYFVCDSLFNQETNYWNNKEFNTGVSIFLTATPEPLLLYLNKTGLIETLKEFHESYSKTSVELKNAQAFKTRIIGFNKTKKCRDEQQYLNAIDEHYKTLKILSDYITERIYNKKDYIFWEEPMSNTYEYYEPYYFNDHENIFDILQGSVQKNNKTLIFVDNEKLGIQLCEKIKRELSLPSDTDEVVFISAPIYRQGEKKAVRTYNQIKSYQKFNCKVLIATSMLDCGISIVDESIKNVVITNADKTSYLQMLGRVRIKNNTRKINLYIQLKTEKAVAAHISSNALTLHILKDLLLLRDISINDYDREFPWMEKEQATKLFNRVVDMNNPNLFKVEAMEPWKASTRSFEIIANFNACLYILYSLHNIKHFDKCIEAPLNFLLLQTQLEWIGKTYDPSRWVGIAAKHAEIEKHFESAMDEWMLADEQEYFKTKCMNLLCHYPIIPSEFKESKSKFLRDGTLLGINKLNDWIISLGFPYKIISKQRYIAKEKKRHTCWKIEKME